MPDTIEAIPDLWPDKFEVLAELPPVSILRQQGLHLGQKTRNLVLGEVRTVPSGKTIRHYFNLRAPLLSYDYPLLHIEHATVANYPVTIFEDVEQFDGLGSALLYGRAPSPPAGL